MTEQEAEAFAERITRIWKPLSVPEWSLDTEQGQFFFHCHITEDVELIHPVFANGPYVSLYSESIYADIEYRRGEIQSSCTAPSDTPTDEFIELSKAVAPFASQWLEVFRRNCWLSGCDIEASAHEKAEWLRGFSREEVEAWNLKM